jgi:ATP-dependent DNA helicase RecG
MIVSIHNSLINIEYLQNKQENQYFERKGLGEKDTKASRIADELIGMLNADGGVLAFGISNSGELQDLNTIAENLSDYRTLVFDFIEPFSNIILEELNIDGKLIFLFHVEHDIERIYKRKDNENIFLRVDDTNRLLDRDAVRSLEYDKQIRKFEDEIEADFDFEDLFNNFGFGGGFENINDIHMKIYFLGMDKSIFNIIVKIIKDNGTHK